MFQYGKGKLCLQGQRPCCSCSMDFLSERDLCSQVCRPCCSVPGIFVRRSGDHAALSLFVLPSSCWLLSALFICKERLNLRRTPWAFSPRGSFVRSLVPQAGVDLQGGFLARFGDEEGARRGPFLHAMLEVDGVRAASRHLRRLAACASCRLGREANLPQECIG